MPKKYQPFIAGFVFGLLGLGLGYLIGKFIKGSTTDIHIGIAIVPVTILVLWLVLAVHEFGHVLGGLLAGFRFRLFAAGPLRIDQNGDRLEFSFNRTPSLWGGIAASSPNPEQVLDLEALRRKMLLLVAGGPAASLLGTLAWVPAMWNWTGSSYLAASLMVFAVGSFCIAIATLIPVGNAGFVNDGARILQLLSRGKAGVHWIASASLSAIATNCRPRDWPVQLVDATTKEIQPTFDGIMAMWTRYSYHLDRSEISEARHWLNLALSHVDCWPAAARPIIHTSAADFYSRIEPDLPRAKAHLKQAAKPGFISKEAFALAESAVLVAEGNFPAAQKSLKLARNSLKALSGSSRVSVEEIIHQLEAKSH